MAAKKKTNINDNLMVTPDNSETSQEITEKIELITSSEPTATNPLAELQSQLDSFDSDFSESVQPAGLEKIEPEQEFDKKELEDQEEKKTEQEESQKEQEEVNTDTKKTAKPKVKKKKKTKKEQLESAESKEDKTNEVKEPEKIKTKRSKKTKKKEEDNTPTKETEIKKQIEPVPLETYKQTQKESKKEEKEPVKKEIKEEIIDINLLTESIADPKIQSSVLVMYNENAELKASLEKAKKLLRILKKKLDLAQEKEEQWRVCAYSLGDIFAEKSHMPLEDVLRRFEAPLDDVLEESM